MKTFSSTAGAGVKIEKAICYSALIVMALLPLLDALLRPFNIAIPYTRHILIRLFLITGLFAATLTTHLKEHICIAMLQFIKSEKAKKVIVLITGLITTVVVTVLFWDSLSFFKTSPAVKLAGLFPDKIFILAMPIAYGIMVIRFAAGSVRGKEAVIWQRFGWIQNILPILAVLLGCVISLPAIAKLIWGFEPPEPFYSWVNLLYDAAHHTRTPLIIFFFLAALAGTPIFAAIAGIALIMFQAMGNEPEAAPIQIYSALTDVDIIAIPLFTLTGFFLSESKSGERLVAAFRSLFGRMTGGMVIATVVICAFFTSFTGASGVTILALGGIFYIILKEKSGYPEKFSLGLLTSVGGIGEFFPPSLPIILVASTINSILFFMGQTVDYSMIDFFLAAIIPGLILVVATIIYGVAVSVKLKVPVERFTAKETGAALKGSAFEILLPFILIGGYFSGILSLVEVSAVSVFYAIIVEMVIYRDIKFKDLPRVFLKAVPITGGILAILAMAKALSYVVVSSQVPERFAFWMQSAIESKYLFLLLLNLALLVIGSFMDILSAILVALPLIVPL